MTHRLTAIAIFALVAGAPISAAAQATITAPPTRDLWPERPLSPAETELRDAIVVLRDTLFSVHAVATRIERGLGGSPAVMLATGRTLGQECAKGARATGVMREYAAGISTSDARWGDVAVADFRAAIAQLERAMTRCGETSATAIASSPVDAEQLQAAQLATVRSIREYEASAKGLLRTLRIPLDPRGSSVPVIN